MLEVEPPGYRYRCDVCGMTARGDSSDHPPPKFATVVVRPGTGLGVIAHLCVGPCLAIGADNLSEGRLANGEVVGR